MSGIDITLKAAKIKKNQVFLLEKIGKTTIERPSICPLKNRKPYTCSSKCTAFYKAWHKNINGEYENAIGCKMMTGNQIFAALIDE